MKKKHTKRVKQEDIDKISDFIEEFGFYEQGFGKEFAEYQSRKFVRDVRKLLEVSFKREHNHIVYTVGDMVLKSGNAMLNLAFAKGINGANILAHGSVIEESNNQEYIDRFNHEVKEPFFDKNRIRACITHKDDLLKLQEIIKEEQALKNLQQNQE